MWTTRLSGWGEAGEPSGTSSMARSVCVVPMADRQDCRCTGDRFPEADSLPPQTLINGPRAVGRGGRGGVTRHSASRILASIKFYGAQPMQLEPMPSGGVAEEGGCDGSSSSWVIPPIPPCPFPLSAGDPGASADLGGIWATPVQAVWGGGRVLISQLIPIVHHARWGDGSLVP